VSNSYQTLKSNFSLGDFNAKNLITSYGAGCGSPEVYRAKRIAPKEQQLEIKAKKTSVNFKSI
jgi:hypothetical protein